MMPSPIEGSLESLHGPWNKLRILHPRKDLQIGGRTCLPAGRVAWEGSNVVNSLHFAKFTKIGPDRNTTVTGSAENSSCGYRLFD